MIFCFSFLSMHFLNIVFFSPNTAITRKEVVTTYVLSLTPPPVTIVSQSFPAGPGSGPAAPRTSSCSTSLPYRSLPSCPARPRPRPALPSLEPCPACGGAGSPAAAPDSSRSSSSSSRAPALSPPRSAPHKPKPTSFAAAVAVAAARAAQGVPAGFPPAGAAAGWAAVARLRLPAVSKAAAVLGPPRAACLPRARRDPKTAPPAATVSSPRVAVPQEDFDFEGASQSSRKRSSTRRR